ncbi:hypothetical protein ALC57_08635 [Trachymyrmex cornetzi]|uniref:Uncharacterized protein n=1 Tax=Trachymyrmex cornetzi TaxID=471704 RepID=A0A195E210_9HYME|nr:hypothetical protein ALC57_08635 [Trachymyrmex cornetzi]
MNKGVDSINLHIRSLHPISTGKPEDENVGIDGSARLAYGKRALFACKPVCAWGATAAAATMSSGFPIPRDRKSRVTRHEGDSATHGARFRLVSDNDDVKHTRVFDSQIEAIGLVSMRVSFCQSRFPLRRGSVRPINGAGSLVYYVRNNIITITTTLLRSLYRAQRVLNSCGVLNESLIPYLHVFHFRVLSLHRLRSNLLPFSPVRETCSSAFEQSFVAVPSANTTNVMGHFLLNLVKSQSVKRCDVPRVSDVYLTTGNSRIEQNHRRRTVSTKKFSRQRKLTYVFTVVPKKSLHYCDL